LHICCELKPYYRVLRPKNEQLANFHGGGHSGQLLKSAELFYREDRPRRVGDSIPLKLADLALSKKRKEETSTL
jgi:hypothetical protein